MSRHGDPLEREIRREQFRRFLTERRELLMDAGYTQAEANHMSALASDVEAEIPDEVTTEAEFDAWAQDFVRCTHRQDRVAVAVGIKAARLLRRLERVAEETDT
jgi:hypothetical protein